MAPIGGKDDLTDEQKTLVEFICKKFEASERIHKDIDPKWNVFYGLSRNYRRLANRHAQAQTPNDRDTVMQEMVRVFGADLFIPYIFTVIETVLPGVLSTDPTISAKPNDEQEATFAACEPVKRLIERDQKRMEYEMRVQETVRSGLRYGLGIQKTFWERCYRNQKIVSPNQSQAGFQVSNRTKNLVYEGPSVESVDVFDFFWDPSAYSIKSSGYLIHRTWRSLKYIEERVAEGIERRSKNEQGGWSELDIESIKSLATTTGRQKVWDGRNEASGLSMPGGEDNELFEVWEFHDRDNVYTVLGRELLVQEAENFNHGEYAFQMFRPTIVEHEFVGVGEAEPISHLNYELNTLRGQRRDAATLALNPPFFYSRGMLRPDQIQWGPGVFNPVDGPPGEVMQQAQLRDLPSSSVEEETALKADIELATGLSEAALGQGSAAETATGAQLNLQVANKRIKQKTKNLHVELLRPTTQQMLALYRENITDDSQVQSIRVEPGGGAEPSSPSSYTFLDVGAAQLNANIEVEPVDGSTEPENDVQKRAEAAQEVDALGPFMEQVEPRAVVKELLRKFGHEDPGSLLKPPGPSVEEAITAVGNTMAEHGIPQPQIEQLLEAAHQNITNPPLSGAQPTPPEQEEEPAASQNGAAPEPTPTGG